MKKLITTLAILAVASATSQETRINTAFNSKNAQIEIERVESNFYYKAFLEASTEKYHHAGVAAGFSHYFKNHDSFRYYFGGKLGTIGHANREISGYNASVGIETGLDYNLSKSISIGVRYVFEWREDLKFYGIDHTASFKGGIFLKLGIKIN